MPSQGTRKSFGMTWNLMGVSKMFNTTDPYDGMEPSVIPVIVIRSKFLTLI